MFFTYRAGQFLLSQHNILCIVTLETLKQPIETLETLRQPIMSEIYRPSYWRKVLLFVHNSSTFESQ